MILNSKLVTGELSGLRRTLKPSQCLTYEEKSINSLMCAPSELQFSWPTFKQFSNKQVQVNAILVVNAKYLSEVVWIKDEK